MEANGVRVTRRWVLKSLGLSSLALAVASCSQGGAASPTSSSPQASSSSAAAPASPRAGLTTVRIGLPAKSLTSAPLFLADALNLFQDAGIKIETNVIPVDANVLAAVANGQLEFGVEGPSILVAYANGQNPLAIVGQLKKSLGSIVVRKEFLDRKQVTPQMPLKTRLESLKGAKLGVFAPGSTIAQQLNFILHESGLNPENYVEWVSLPDAGTQLAGIQKGLVDGIASSTPTPQQIVQAGAGVAFLGYATDVPTFRDITGTALYGKKDWIESNADLAQRTAQVVGRACNILNTDSARSKKALKTFFSDLDPSLVDQTVDGLVDAWPADGKMNEQAWKNLVDTAQYFGSVKSPAPTTEGVVWTNKYLVNVPKS